MRKPLIIIGVIIILLIVLVVGFFMHRQAVARLFAALEQQPGATIEIGGHSGNLFTGYTLRDVIITPQSVPEDLPPVSVMFPELRIAWTIRPMLITEVSWPEASLEFDTGNGTEPILVGPGELANDEEGWLNSVADIVLGNLSWDGRLNVNIKEDLGGYNGVLTIEKFPIDQVSNFGFESDPLPGTDTLFVQVTFEGVPEDVTGTGQAAIELAADVSEPVTFSTPRLEINWDINPFTVTDITWDAGSMFYTYEGQTEEMSIDPGVLINDASGWLVLPSEQGIGARSWAGTLDLKIRDDFEIMQCQIVFETLPFDKLDTFTAIPEGFTSSDNVKMILTFNGPLGNPSVRGTVSNPVTREMFRF